MKKVLMIIFALTLIFSLICISYIYCSYYIENEEEISNTYYYVDYSYINRSDNCYTITEEIVSSIHKPDQVYNFSDIKLHLFSERNQQYPLYLNTNKTYNILNIKINVSFTLIEKNIIEVLIESPHIVEPIIPLTSRYDYLTNKSSNWHLMIEYQNNVYIRENNLFELNILNNDKDINTTTIKIINYHANLANISIFIESSEIKKSEPIEKITYWERYEEVLISSESFKEIMIFSNDMLIYFIVLNDHIYLT